MATGTQWQRFEALCRAQGLALTVQRRAILECLAERKDHPTADQIYQAVARRLPGVSRATVYRSLETLVGAGVARKVWYAGAAARFELPFERHHHLVCVLCDKVMDFRSPALDRLPQRVPPGSGFRLIDYSVQFVGVCRDCAARGRRPSTRPSSSRRVTHEGK